MSDELNHIGFRLSYECDNQPQGDHCEIDGSDHDTAWAVYNALVEAGVDIGNASVSIIKAALGDVKQVAQPDPTEQTFRMEGNKGGDHITIIQTGEDTVRLEVGHCCVRTIDYIVPIEFLTLALSRAVMDAGNVRHYLRGSGWPEDVVQDLIDKIKADEAWSAG